MSSPAGPSGPRPEERTVAATTVSHRVETHDTLDRLLDTRRARHGSARRVLGGTGAALLHALVVGGIVFGPQLFAKPPRQIEFVPVHLVPAPARGVERPAPPKPAATAAPQPEPEPEPEPSAPAMAEPTQPEAKPQATPEPKPATNPAAAPTPTVPPAAPPSGPPGPQGAPNGRPDSPFTATVGGVDNPTFTYGYYLDRILLLIRAQWTRPALGSGVEATVHFRILRDGTVESIELVSSSGYNSFDLAALRALQSAAPLPPLPRGFREGELGVTLMFR